MRLMYNIILFALVVNCAVWLVQVFGLIPFVNMPAKYNPTDIAAMFSLEVFAKNFMYTLAAGAAAGIAMLLLRQNTYALYALVIFAVGIFLPIVSNFLMAIPNMIDAIMYLYPAYNPLSGVVGSGLFLGTNPYSMVIAGLGYFAAFFFIMDKITGGQTA